MELKSLSNSSEEKPSSTIPDVAENNYATFEKGDEVMLKSDIQEYSCDLKNIAGIKLQVVRCFTKDLGDGVEAEILYLNKERNKEVQNPYLAEHFKRIV